MRQRLRENRKSNRNHECARILDTRISGFFIERWTLNVERWTFSPMLKSWTVGLTLVRSRSCRAVALCVGGVLVIVLESSAREPIKSPPPAIQTKVVRARD